jgi:hypothetical protein
MDSNRKTAIIVGVLFLIATVIIIIGGVFSLSIYETDYLLDMLVPEYLKD